MNRFITVFILMVMVSVFSGCSTMSEVMKSDKPFSTDIVKQSAAPNTYTSKALGFTFTVPNEWVGRYRVEEGNGILSVYYVPSEPLDNVNDSELFAIVTKTFEFDLFSEDWRFQLNGTDYILGMSDTMYLWFGTPDYNTFIEMQDDLPTIFASIRSESGKLPNHIKKLWKEFIPTKPLYTSEGLGISFTLPKSWIGKCRVVEYEEFLDVYFKPEQPINKKDGDGFFFTIAKKTSEDDEAMLDSIHEFKIHGATYFSATSTDVPYSEELPEYDTYMEMFGDYSEIIDSIRAAK